MLTQSEIDAIKQEAENVYRSFSNNRIDMWNRQDAYIRGATEERQRAKVLCEKINAFMATIPLDNGNWYLSNFDVALAELKEILNTYNKNKP